MRETPRSLHLIMFVVIVGSVGCDSTQSPLADSSSSMDLDPDGGLVFADAGCVDHCRNGGLGCGEEGVDCGGECPPCASSSADFYVDPLFGDDSADGSRARPFFTLQRVRDAVRLLRQAEPQRTTPVLVLLRGGTFWLTGTLRLTAADSGTETSPTIYRAYPTETPLVSGGKLLEGFRVDEQGRWRLTLTEVVSEPWVFTQLWVDGQRRIRPRLPKQDHYFIHRKAEPLGDTGDRDNRFGFLAEELRADWHNLGDVEVLAWHQWTISRLRIQSVDAKARLVTFTTPTRCTQSHCQLKPGYRYLVENVKEALTEPGEWYLDAQSGELIYLPLPGEQVTQTAVIAPRLQQLLVVGEQEGAATTQVHFEGIHFAHTHYATPQEGYSGRQAEVELSAAIELVNAQRCALKACTISHTGAWGVRMGLNCRDNSLQASVLTDLGAGGVRIGGDEHQSDETQVASGNLISDNLITGGGRMHPAGVGVLLTHAAHSTVEHNEITDLYYSGISVGWQWGYSASNTHHNTIAYNHVHNIGQGVLSDMGGIYTLGISPGTLIHHNLFHDISRIRYGGWGIYFDQASSNITAEYNVVYDTQDAPFHIHFGENNTLRNNIWIAEHAPPLRRSKAEQRHALTVERNVFYSAGAQMLSHLWDDGLYTFDKNLYWSTSGEELDFDGRSFTTWQAEGQDVQSTVADPAFIDPASRDYSFEAGSPTAQLGIATVDVSTAGRISAPRGADLAPLPRAFPAAVGTAPIDINFEDMPAGQPPTVGETHAGDGSGGLQVTDLSGAAGTLQSLRFQDAADNTKSHNPHYVLRTDQADGTYQLAFSLRWESGARVQLQWRDWRATPYVVGPSIEILADGVMTVQDKSLVTLPAGQWVRFEITVGLGAQADGTFSLSVQPAGAAKQLFSDLACGSSSFDTLSWIGFISMSTSATDFYLDEVVDHVL